LINFHRLIPLCAPERFAKEQIIEMMGEIPENVTARQILEHFDSTYACKNLATQLNVQDKLFITNLMIRDLIACGNENETTKVWYLFSTLPHSYDGVIRTVKTMSDDCLTLAFVKKLLLEYEQKLQKESADTSTKALQFQPVYYYQFTDKRKLLNKGNHLRG
jgi:hypothetical protein